MGNSLFSVVSNILREYFKETASYKPTKWLRYIDENLVVLPHGPAGFQQSQQGTPFHYCDS
jgi:hypothetical protein